MNYSFLFYEVGIAIFCSLGMASQDQEVEPYKVERKNLENTTIWGITEAQLDQLFENSSDYVLLTDEHQISRVNKTWTEILGWTAEELTSTPFLNFLHPEDVLSSKSAANVASNISCLINFENRYRTTKGDYHRIKWFTLIQVSGSPRKSPLLAIGKDLTLEKEREEQRYALQQAEAASRLKSTFVAHMSHEIRTPLNGVLGFLNLALEEQMSESLRSHVQNAQESSHFLLGVANDIIDVSKIEANALKLDKVNFNPFAVIKTVMSLLTLQAQKKNLSLTSSIDPDLPPVLQGDENRLKQILFNLLGNAIKFTPQGKVSLKIRGHSQEGNPPLFLLQGQIKDTGIGIEPQFISHLFKPFSQEDHSMRRQFGGAGLGLYITKQLCERMGGTVSVLSVPGSGTTFQFHVLFGQPPLRSPHIDRKPSLSPVPIIEALPVSKVLVVEDNLMNQKIITILLKKLGCEVDIAENGLKGIEAVKSQVYDLVLMDGEMPVMDGLEATRAIRQQFSDQELPIIGLSAHAMTTHREQFLAAGMNGYLTKPINKDALAQEIISCIQALH